MNALDAIFTRRSIRKFSDTPISVADTKTILRAAMAAPTAKNLQPWRFLVITERELLDGIAGVHPNAGMAKTASLGILVCIDDPDAPTAYYWEQDCAASIQNILLAGRALNIGTVWCGVHPIAERIEAMSKLFNLPKHVKPLGLVLAGHTDLEFSEQDRYDESKLHYNKW